GPVSHVTGAPELPGAYELMELLRQRGITVSCGHSNATAAEARDAFSRGAKTVTHIFNAMRPFAAREPGLAGAALVSGDVVVQVILDGVHLADDTARLVWQGAPRRGAPPPRRGAWGGPPRAGSPSSPTRPPQQEPATAATRSPAWTSRSRTASPAAPS